MAKKPENDDEAYSGCQGTDANFVNFAARTTGFERADASQQGLHFLTGDILSGDVSFGHNSRIKVPKKRVPDGFWQLSPRERV